ncbi:MAG: cation-transporting P-type ATPase [Candidatus Pacearchaeota archaeon]
MKKEEIVGLSSAESKKRLEEHGFNEIKDVNKISSFKILIRQVKSNFIIYLLLVAMILSFLVSKNITAYVLLFVILILVTTGFIQEYKAEKSVQALKKMITSTCLVLRDGKEKEIYVKELVPGDILILRNGEKIPADCLILYKKELLVNESVLTGEAHEIKKEIAIDPQKYEDKNVLFMGSFIVRGKAIAKVIHTGMNTKFGKIAKLISKSEKELLLQKKVNNIAKYMATIGLFFSILTGLIILFRAPELNNQVIVEALILVIAVAVSSFPEGFPVVLITALATGSYRMAKKNAIVNRMSIIETLGETTVICSDKTGTITKGEMTVTNIYSDNKEYTLSGTGYNDKGNFYLDNKPVTLDKEKSLQLLLKAGIYCNDAHIYRSGQEEGDFDINGTPTEASLLIAASKAKLFYEDLYFDRKEENPFSSERKMMSVLIKEKKENFIYAKGALEVLLDKCSFIQRNSGVYRLLEKDKKKILEENKRFGSESLRTLAFAYKITKNNFNKKIDFEKDLIFLGFVGIRDPPREEVKESVRMCKKAGIKVKMITGDSKETAYSIAKQIGLDKGKILEGFDIDKLTDDELTRIVNKTVIFARVRPEHKLRIVKALKENGEIVTMTGDGVNDAPALKEAHIGVAMGKSGTDVSRSVADLIIKDDDFSTIVDAIKEGRTIFNNIRKFVTYQLSANIAELIIIVIGALLVPIFGWPIPLLLALQILFMNIVTDNLPAITLGLNKSSQDIMDDKPRVKAQILNKNFVLILIFSGIFMALLVLITFYFTYNILGQTIESARTTSLIALIFLEIAGAFNFRSFRKGTIGRSLLTNPSLAIASFVSILATVLIIYTPLNIIFETVHIPLIDWIFATGLGIFYIIVFDIFKKINVKNQILDFN